jgi:hypothetical protein
MKRSRADTISLVPPAETKRQRSTERIETLSSLTRDAVVNGNHQPVNTQETFFQHRALDSSRSEIRLLRVVPATEDGIVRCDIDAVAFGHSVPPYKALSYMWGATSSMHRISLNGLPFEVTENLHDFLQVYHWQIVRPEFLWVDQLCIDQTSLAEKSGQVTMVAPIYQRANEVVIWLGSENQHTNLAMAFFAGVKRWSSLRHFVSDWSEIANLFFDDSHTSWQSNQRLLNLYNFYHDLICSGSTQLLPHPYVSHAERVALLRNAVIALFTNPYWSRLWIVQEILLSTTATVVWGQCAVPLTNIQEFELSPGNLTIPEAEAPRKQFELLMSRYAPETGDKTRSSLYEALNVLHASGCSEPKDKVYGVLALVAPGHGIVIDYTKSVEDVFLDAVEAMARTEQEVNAGMDVRRVVWLCVQLAGQMFPQRLGAVTAEEVEQFIAKAEAQPSTVVRHPVYGRRTVHLIEPSQLRFALASFLDGCGRSGLVMSGGLDHHVGMQNGLQANGIQAGMPNGITIGNGGTTMDES